VSYQYAITNKFEAHPYYISAIMALGILVLTELSKLYITLGWAAIAFTSLFLGLQTDRPVPKNVGLILIGITVCKLLVIDTTQLSEGLRIIGYIVLGVLLLLGSVAYKKLVKE